MLDDLEPISPRGIIRIGEVCEHCDRPEPVFGRPGKGRPLETFSRGYFCRGHAIRI